MGQVWFSELKFWQRASLQLPDSLLKRISLSPCFFSSVLSLCLKILFLCLKLLTFLFPFFFFFALNHIFSFLNRLTGAPIEIFSSQGHLGTNWVNSQWLNATDLWASRSPSDPWMDKLIADRWKQANMQADSSANNRSNDERKERIQCENINERVNKQKWASTQADDWWSLHHYTSRLMPSHCGSSSLISLSE